MRNRLTKAERAEALERARRDIVAGQRIYWRTVHRSRSGMARWLRFYFVSEDGAIVGAAHYVGAARGTGCAWKGGESTVYFGGCGFCAGSEGVADLSDALGYRGADALRAEGL